jgi:hypothetical protein
MMSRESYDAAGGLARLLAALDGIDPRASDILASHIALEREVEVVLDRLLPRAEFLAGLGYAHKVKVLAAAWQGEEIDARNVFDVLMKFGTLRNKVAHGNTDVLDQAYDELRTSYRRLAPDEEGSSVTDIAGGIISFFGDAPTPAEIRLVADRIWSDQMTIDLQAWALDSLPANLKRPLRSPSE